MKTRDFNYQIEDYPFHHETCTRWKDMDSFEHVNNAIFLTFIEDARIIFFKRWNINQRKKSLIVASVKIDYLNQLKHPCNLIIGQKVSRIGSKSFDIESVIFNKREKMPLAFSLVTCVCYDYEKKKSIPVFPEIIADQNI